MEILIKTKEYDEEKRRDNEDKKKLFTKDRHPRSANHYKDEWFFIENKKIRDNIAYQMQYVEYLVCLYNDYQIYLTVESLLCKTIMVTIACVVEGALYDLLSQMERRGYNAGLNQRRDFLFLIDIGLKCKIIDSDMNDTFHNLRKVRNLVHITSARELEYAAYDIDQANHYIKEMDRLRDRVKANLREWFG